MYKRSLSLVLVVFALFVSLAQAAISPISKGALTIGGGGTYMSFSNDAISDDERFSVVLVYPSLGLFVSNSLCVGGQLILGSASLDGDDVSVMGVGPQLTFYLSNPNKVSNYSHRAIPYVTGSALFGQYSDGEEWTARTVTLGAGVVAMLAKNIGGFFEANYAFDHLSQQHQGNQYDDIPDSETSYDGNRFGIQLGLRLFVW